MTGEAEKKKIAFLGLGLMGFPMSRRLARAGYRLTVWNRDAAKAKPLEAEGAAVAASATDAVRDADIVFTMMTNGDVVGTVLFDGGVADAMKKGAVLIDTSSVAPSIAREHSARLADIGIRHLDAPVSGGVVGAEAGTLAIMAGGDADVVAGLADVFAVLGRVTHVGPSGAGQVCKLANQQIVAVTIGAVAEAMICRGRRCVARGVPQCDPRRVCRKPHSGAAWRAHGGAEFRTRRLVEQPAQGPEDGHGACQGAFLATAANADGDR